MTADQLRDAMRKRFTAMTMNEWCRLTGCKKSHVSEFMNGKRLPPGDMLRALNMRVDYVKNHRRALTPSTAQETPEHGSDRADNGKGGV